MRRVKTLTANDDGISMQITIKLDATNVALTSWEVAKVINEITDRIMRVIPDTSYFHTPLHKIKVK